MALRGFSADTALLWFSDHGVAQTNLPAATNPPQAPAVLPGKGLAQHDFFYAGEAKEERLFIVRGGQIVWSYTHPGRGEISDAVLEPDGNILFAHQFGITEISPDKQVVWNFDAPAKTEIHTAQPIGTNRVWFIQNGNPAKFIVISKTTGEIQNQFELPVKDTNSVHGQFRHARLTDAGTVLVAHMDLGKAVEYDPDGKALWSVDVPGIWSATPLPNGNILAASNRKFVREINRKGETVWEWTAADAPDYKLSNPQIATRLPNGNTIINNWFNQWSGKADSANAPVQAIEVTPDKKVVWALHSWSPPADLGPSTIIQILDDVSAPAGAVASTPAEGAVRRLVFDGVKSEQKWALNDLNPGLPSDWSPYNYLVLEIRTSSPQRFSLWVYTANGPRRIMLQPFGQNVWLRASIPLSFLKGRDQKGSDLASVNNRRTDSFWMSVWGPFGDLAAVQSLAFVMDYPINKPAVEIRAVRLSKEDEGSKFLEKTPVLDEFGQWAYADWPRKIQSRAQLDQERADEDKSLKPGDFGYCQYGGYTNTHAQATGFFHVEQIDGKWWFVDPHGHLFLSTSCNGLGGRGGRGGGANAQTNLPSSLQARRLDAWGFNTGAQGMNKPYIVMVAASRGSNSFLGLPDVYSDAFARTAEQTAVRLCAPRQNDPLVLGYFIGNEPPWANRETEVVDMILKGPETETRFKLEEFLKAGDTPERRTNFVIAAFQKQLAISCGAIRREDPHHLILGIRFGGEVPDAMLRAGHVFDVCSINVYEYEPTKQVERAYRVSGRPVLIGEFHFGVPADGLGAGLVQTQNQVERANGYRYYIEQAAALPGFLGAHWFTWRDEPVLGRFDGENYNIGFVDVTDRPYPELVEGAKATHARLFEVHSGTAAPFSLRPKASSAGTPASPWTE